MKRKLKARLPNTLPSWYRGGPSRRTRQMFARHGEALSKSLALRMERKALNSGHPWKYKLGRDIHGGLKRFLLRLISTIRETAR